MKSIISNKKECFICKSMYGLEVHHCIHGYGRRKLADADGLTVYLCHVCHRNLHDLSIHDRDLQMLAQKRWQEHNHKTVADFRARYGKSYLYDG